MDRKDTHSIELCHGKRVMVIVWKWTALTTDRARCQYPRNELSYAPAIYQAWSKALVDGYAKEIALSKGKEVRNRYGIVVSTNLNGSAVFRANHKWLKGFGEQCIANKDNLKHFKGVDHSTDRYTISFEIDIDLGLIKDLNSLQAIEAELVSLEFKILKQLFRLLKMIYQKSFHSKISIFHFKPDKDGWYEYIDLKTTRKKALELVSIPTNSKTLAVHSHQSFFHYEIHQKSNRTLRAA